MIAKLEIIYPIHADDGRYVNFIYLKYFFSIFTAN